MQSLREDLGAERYTKIKETADHGLEDIITATCDYGVALQLR